MQVLNKINLFDLCGQKLQIPIFVRSNFLRINSIANSNGELFNVDNEGKLSSGKNVNLLEYESAVITSFESKSGILSLAIKRGYSIQYFQIPDVYTGFKPIYDLTVETNEELEGASNFMFTICNIFRICNIYELSPQDSTLITSPLVSLVLDDSGRITSIGNLEENC